MKWKIIATTVLLSCFAAVPSFAEGSLQNLKQGTKQSLQASGNFALSGTQAVVAVVATPLKLVGKVGVVSDEVSSEMLDFAINGPNKPLDISDETLTIGPNPSLAIAVVE